MGSVMDIGYVKLNCYNMLNLKIKMTLTTMALLLSSQ
jgi:hypothetical protein